MPSTPDSILRLELQAVAENANTWGIKANNNFDLLGQAIAGTANVNVGGSGNYTLVASNYVTDEARAATLVLTGTLSGNRDVIVPSSPKHYTIINQTSGAFPLTIRQVSGTGVVIPAGSSQIVCTSTTCVGVGINDVSKAGDTMTGALNFAPEVNLASAATTDLGAQTSNNVRITGTTTITSFGTAANGVTRELRFADALTLTHNATSLILPGGANITTAAGDTGTAKSLGSGNWVVTDYMRARAFGGYQQIQRQTVSGVSAVDFTLPSGFRQFRLEISNGRVGTSGQSLGLRCGVGATFDAGASDYSGAYLTHSGTSPISDAGASGSFINLTLGLAVNDLRSLVEVAIDPGSASSRFMARISSGVIQSTGPSTRFYNAFYFRTDDGAKDAIRILASGGANIAGTFTLLGIAA